MTHPATTSICSLSLFVLMIGLAVPFEAHARQRLSQTYSATLVEGEFKGIKEIDTEKLTGIWLVQFLPGEALSIIHNGDIVLEGDWAFDNEHLTLTRMSGPLVCANEDAGSAVYRVLIRGFSVSFEAEAETCSERAAILTRGLYRASAR